MTSREEEEEVKQKRPKEIDEATFREGITQARPSRPQEGTTSHQDGSPDALHPISALGAFPLGKSPLATNTSAAVKGIWRSAALYACGWSALALAITPTLPALVLVLTGNAFFSILLQRTHHKLQLQYGRIEADQFEARSAAMREAGIPESVEWLQAIIEGVWPRIPADMFSNVADMLEDTIQANLPSFIPEVKCAELSQGKNPLRVLSSRLLPPTDEDKEEMRRHGGVQKYINLEVAFAYQAVEKRKGMSKPTKENARKMDKSNDLPEITRYGQDAHILFHFQVKMGPAAVALPVKVLLNGLVAIANLRIETTSASPFLGEMTISFKGLPRVSLDVIPLKLSLAEVPGLAGIIQSSVDSALDMYTMPKSLTFNLGETMVGDGIKRECDACGVVIVTLHSGHKLERSDVRGKSDPYARVNWSRTSTASTRVTRVIKNSLSPVWEHSFAMVVSPQVLAALNSTGQEANGESICVQIFDSDSTSDDDSLGKATWPLREAMRQENVGKMVRKESELCANDKSGARGGTIQWSVGYFAKMEAEADDGEEQRPADEQDRKIEQPASKTAGISPHSEQALGILAIQIHQISSLRFRDLSRSDEDEEEEPSSYVEVILADRRVFRSRTKMDDGEPCFNAMTEQVCNWRTANCVFVVRENRVAGKNAILGVVPIKLCDIFEKSFLVTDTYPMAGGIGSGRIRISLLFRGLQLPNPAPRLPSSVGVLTVHSLCASVHGEAEMKKLEGSSIQLVTYSSSAHLSSRRFKKTGANRCEWEMDTRAVLPVYRREATALMVKVRLKQGKLRGRETIAMAPLWLNQVDDLGGSDMKDSTQTFELALWDAKSNKHGREIIQRHWTSASERDEEKIELKLLGTLQIRVDFYTGVTRMHSTANKLAGDSSKVYEAYCALSEAGLEDQNQILQDIPSNPDRDSDDSSDSSSDDDNSSSDTNTGPPRAQNNAGHGARIPLQESGSKGQLINRLLRRTDYETTSFRDEFKQNVAHIKTRFQTDNDKTEGVETEV